MDTEIFKYGAPNEYGDFPYLYGNAYRKEDLNDILRERLPENYNMEIVDPIESLILAECSKIGIDSHLEAMTQNKPDRIEDRKIGDRVVGRHHALDFSRSGMICLIRRLAEYDPTKFDHSDLPDNLRTDYEWDSDIEESDRENQPYDFWSAARMLRSLILETLQIETFD